MNWFKDDPLMASIVYIALTLAVWLSLIVITGALNGN